MNRDEIRSGVNDAVDRARDAANDLLSNGRAKLNDEFHDVAGRAKGAYGDTLETLESRAREQPLPALALALGIGFVIGLLALRR